MSQVPTLEECQGSGILPTEFNVLIKPAEVESKTKGGIILPSSAKDAEQFAEMRGRLVAVSPLAFTYEHWPVDARKPRVGDVVVFAKFGGVVVTGNDGSEWRVCKDKDIMAIIEEIPDGVMASLEGSEL